MILSFPAGAAEQTAKYYNAEGRRDPFIPLVAGGVRPSGSLMNVETPDDLILEGIAYDPAGSLVIVNGSMLKEGEVVGNTKVLRIEPSKVTFEVNGMESVKEVHPNSQGGQ